MSSMKCEVCKNRPAQLHITRIVEGKVYALHVCQVCAEEKGLSNPIVFTPLASLLQQSEEAAEKIADPEEAEKQLVICPGCGKSDENFRESGNLGCDQCYAAFEKGLEKLMARVQRDTHHIGKVPLRAGTSMNVEASINKLREQLQEAVKREDFESAARIRDRIRDLDQRNSP